MKNCAFHARKTGLTLSASDGERAGVRCLLPFLFLLVIFFLSSLPAHAATTTFTTNALLSETNFAYDGQDIVVSGATLTVDGPHAFNSLLTTNGAVPTHSPCIATEPYSLNLVVANALVVRADSRRSTRS